LAIGSIEEYVQSPEDPAVGAVVRKYLTAVSDEKIANELASGNITTMLEMIQSQSALMKELEAKLAGVTAISWEELSEREKAEAELRRQHQMQELARCRMEIEENAALVAVGQLVDLMQWLGRTDGAIGSITHARKHHKQRGARDIGWDPRGDMDDWSARQLLSDALVMANQLINDFPYLRGDIEDIRGRISEQLARFS